MKRFPSRLAIAMLAGFLAFPAAAAAPVAKVNGVAIPAERAEAMLAEQRAQGAQDSSQLQDAVREELVRREVLSQEASNQGLAKKSEVQTQMDLAKQAILIRSYVQQYVQKNPIKDEQLQAEYEKIKAQVGSTEYKARHILVKEEAEAKAAIEGLKKGQKFDELAKQSIDPGSKDNGGDLGWAAPSNYVKPFADALTALGKGKYTETPVKSEFGYHVIELEDTRPLNAPAFEELKPRLLQQAQGEQINKMVEELRGKAKVN